MALTATIFKAELQISDMDRNYYGEHLLTLARHPSETDERMMVRLLAFALNADENLTFTPGMGVDDQPDLWQKSLSDEIELWIDVGLPEEKRVRKACNRSQKVCLYLYGSRAAEPWWQKNEGKLKRFHNLSVVQIPDVTCSEMADLVERNMQLQCTVQDGDIYLSTAAQTLTVSPQVRKLAD
jgi:uncharacterized protein YaeQ